MSFCVQHSNVPAAYRCDGCSRLLCPDCIEESYRLLLCGHCGELAVPLESKQAATTQQLEKVRTASKTYSLQESLTYPFIGMGLFIFFFAIFIEGAAQYGGIRIGLLMTALMAALQFKIVRTTIRGQDELDSWPDFTAWSEMFSDLIAWILLEGSFTIMIMIYMGAGIFQTVLGIEPSFGGSIAFAALLWVWTGFQIIGYGVAAGFSPVYLFLIHKHVRAYKETFGDAVHATNLVFMLRGVTFFAAGLVAFVPLLGLLLSVAVEAYYLFLVSRLSGLLYRKHEAVLDEIYMGRGAKGA